MDANQASLDMHDATLANAQAEVLRLHGKLASQQAELDALRDENASLKRFADLVANRHEEAIAELKLHEARIACLEEQIMAWASGPETESERLPFAVLGWEDSIGWEDWDEEEE